LVFGQSDVPLCIPPSPRNPFLERSAQVAFHKDYLAAAFNERFSNPREICSC
jgi:hypothetical protein